MDWNRIKTIFILAFLILDLLLLSQLVTKHKVNQFEVKNDVSLEDNSKIDGIEYGNLPKEVGKDQYMSANTKSFFEKDVSELKNQTVEIENGTMIRAELEEPLSFSEKNDFSELSHFVKANLLYGDQYEYWNYDKEAGTITYYQKFNGRPLFLNRSAHLVFYVNEDRKIESYEQTLLETFEPINEKEEVLSPVRAIEALYRKGVLKPGSKIEKAELGYYTLVNIETSQVLNPTWLFVVEYNGKKENMLVNAFEGQVIHSNSGSENNKME